GSVVRFGGRVATKMRAAVAPTTAGPETPAGRQPRRGCRRGRGRGPPPGGNGRSVGEEEGGGTAAVGSRGPRSRPAPDSPVRSWLTYWNSGQCHRYSPYEMRPTHTSGATLSTRATGPSGNSTACVSIAATESPPMARPPR